MEDNQGTLLSDHGLTDFDMYIMDTTSRNTRSELVSTWRSLYCLACKSWKMNKLKYPTLSKLVRDILTIQISTADPDSIFDTEIKELDQ